MSASDNDVDEAAKYSKEPRDHQSSEYGYPEIKPLLYQTTSPNQKTEMITLQQRSQKKRTI